MYIYSLKFWAISYFSPVTRHVEKNNLCRTIRTEADRQDRE